MTIVIDGHGHKAFLKPNDVTGSLGAGDLALNIGVKKRLTLIDLFEAIKAAGFKGWVYITTIVCYAGGWAVEAQRLWTKSRHPCVSQL